MSLTTPTLPVVDVTLAGDTARLALRVPRVEEALLSVLGPEQHSERLIARSVPLELHTLIASWNGAPPTMAQARALAADVEMRRAVLESRTRMYREWRELGCALLLCPGCQRAEAELTPQALAERLGAKPWPIADRAGLLAAPCLSAPPHPEPRPPGLRVAARVGLRLPGAALGSPVTEGTLRRLDPRAEALAWARFAPMGEDPPEEHDTWTSEEAGFRAVLRACVVLRELEGAEATPDRLEPLPFVDLLLVDDLYWLCFCAQVREPERALVRCSCGTRFLPVGA